MEGKACRSPISPRPTKVKRKAAVCIAKAKAAWMRAVVAAWTMSAAWTRSAAAWTRRRTVEKFFQSLSMWICGFEGFQSTRCEDKSTTRYSAMCAVSGLNDDSGRDASDSVTVLPLRPLCPSPRRHGKTQQRQCTKSKSIPNENLHTNAWIVWMQPNSDKEIVIL